MKKETQESIAALLAVMARLREPEGGCPWDLEQDMRSLAPHTVEEAYEVADAAERGDIGDLQEELGDLLLQVVFYAQMAAEAGQFDFGDVAQGIVDKLIRRHPHVFGDEQQSTAAGVKSRWDEIKAAERASKGKAHNSLLDAVPANLPGLAQALKLQKKAAKVGFDWTAAAPVFAKVAEELGELKEAAGIAGTAGATQPAAEELGDLLFSCVNLARHLRLDPDAALRQANRKFRRRFHQMEQSAPKPLQSLSSEDLETLWNAAKQS